MAGHSKWANTKHRKAAQDAKRAKIFTKIIRELTVAAKEGGANPDDNPKLRAVIDKALGANMKRDTIDKAVQRGAGGGEGHHYESCTYEGYGNGGIAVLVECLTDNKNRTVSEVRHAFSKRGGNLGTDGSVAYLFSRVGLIHLTENCDEERAMDAALELGAEDFSSLETGGFLVTTSFENYLTIKEALAAENFGIESAELTMIASTEVLVTSSVEAEKTIALIDMLEDLDDVQAVHTNAHFDDNVLNQLNQS